MKNGQKQEITDKKYRKLEIKNKELRKQIKKRRKPIEKIDLEDVLID